VRFKDIIGQKETIERFTQSINTGRISHAQLLIGPEGSGALPLAIAYSQYINCTNKRENDSCGECPSCKKTQKLIHPDLHFVFPVANTSSSGKGAVSDNFIEQWREFVLSNPYQNLNEWLSFLGVENKQGGIQKSESSEILKKLTLKTYEAEYKVMIIWMAEKMNETCANKLLKIIEEPSEKTVFLLIAENTEAILQTILSRVQVTRLHKIKDHEIATSIANNFPLAEIPADAIAEVAKGNANKAIQLATGAISTALYFQLFTNFMRLAYTKNFIEIQKLQNDFASLGREKQKLFLEYSLGLIRENFILNQQSPEIVHLLPEEKQFSSKFSPFINERNIAILTKEFNEAHYHIERNGNPKIIFLDLALKTIIAIKQ